MKLNIFNICSATAVAVAAMASVANAGNVPQYTFSQGDKVYSELTDATVVDADWAGSGLYIFADENTTGEFRFAGKAFDIGFGFRLGGQVFTKFALCNDGRIFFGNDDTIDTRTAFCLRMSLNMDGVKSGNISYKTEGDEGNRVFVVQYKDMTVAETGVGQGKYNLQMRCYEADGKIELAFDEVETCYGPGHGFHTGIRGWDDRDVLLLTGNGLTDSDISVSETRKADLLDATSYIKWDSYDYDNHYNPVYVLSPVADSTAPTQLPTLTKLNEDNGVLSIEAKRATDAAATVLLISDQPLTGAELPTDGVTFPVGAKIGNATVLYYSDGNYATADTPIESGKTYYIALVSANGYPAFNTSESVEFATSQSAPTAFKAEATGTQSIKLDWQCADNVIVAMTDKCDPSYNVGYTAIYGTPGADAMAGDKLNGGGTVVYSGSASEFELTDCPANRMLYFRAWSVKDGRVSGSYAETHCVPEPSLPYEPDIENYPMAVELQGGWVSNGTGDPLDAFTPSAKGGQRCLYGKTIMGNRTWLISPALPLNSSCNIEFEYALETIRPTGTEIGDTPLGYEPGIFGEGHGLHVFYGANGTETEAGTVTEYLGTMTSVPGQGYYTDSSTFDKVSFDLPNAQPGDKVGIAISTERFSHAFIRKISITDGSGVKTTLYDSTLAISSGKGSLSITSTEMQVVAIYDLQGAQVAKIMLMPGCKTTVNLPAGLYVAAGRKVLVR